MCEKTTLLLAEWRSHKDLLLTVRYAVFVEEQGIPASIEIDVDDEAAIHRLAIDAAGRPIGTARLLPDGQIGRVAVLREHRRKRVGSKLVKALIQDATHHGYKQVMLHAQLRSLEFYEQLGFKARGDIFEEVGIPHREMILDL